MTLSIINHFDECTLSQEKRVPTDRQTLSMHQYVFIESHRKAYVALWLHLLPLSQCEPAEYVKIVQLELLH